jgi:anti-sigma regulatory factor (Ser/Thr protein kinase)
MADRRAMVFTTQYGVPTITRILPRAKESAPDARRLVSALLEEWDLPLLTDDAALIVTELVANSVTHGRGQSIRLTVTRPEPKLVCLSVVDKDHRKPQVVEAGPDDESGRGLCLVACLSHRWGVDPKPWGKRVWAEVGKP